MTMPTDSIKISQLPGATSSSPSDEFPLNQGGVTKKTSPALLSTDWKSLEVLPTVTYLGQRSYSLTFLDIDYSGILSAGMRFMTERTTAAPVRSTTLNGTNQYWNNTSPNKLTFTDDFVVSAWVKLTSYPTADSNIISRYNGSSGWQLYVSSDGIVALIGRNGGAGNYSQIRSVQSIPIGRWVHVALQLDMSAFTATTTTSYIMLDGVNVAALVNRGGTNPTALTQAGSLEIGSTNGGTGLLATSVAQVAVFSAKVSQTAMQGYISQGIIGSEADLASAYSFDNNANDLNTTTPNNLTAQNAAGYTSDSPFGMQTSGVVDPNIDYGIIMSVSGGTNTSLIVQVPEGCTIPTAGGLTAVNYSTAKAPFGFPTTRNRWTLRTLLRTVNATTSNASYGSYVSGGFRLTVPIGSWLVGWRAGIIYNGVGANVYFAVSDTDLTGMNTGAAYAVTDLILRIGPPASGTNIFGSMTQSPKELSTAKTFTMYTIGSTTAAGLDGAAAPLEIYAENVLL